MAVTGQAATKTTKPKQPVKPKVNLLTSAKPVSLSTSARPSSAPSTSGGYTPQQSGTRPAAAVAQATPRPISSGGEREAPAPAPVFEEPRRREREIDWRDAAYNAQIAAINRALADFETELGLGGERYGTDYLKGIRELGFRPGEGFRPTVDIFALPEVSAQGAPGASGLSAVRRAMMPVTSAAAQTTDVATPMAQAASVMAAPEGGQWDYEGQFNPFSAAARGTRTARDEFAGRGTLRSSDFARSYADFQDRMQRQLEAMETGRARYFEDAAMNLAQQRSQAEERRQAAQRDAIMRAAIMAAR